MPYFPGTENSQNEDRLCSQFGLCAFIYFIFYLKIHPKVGVKYNRTLSPLQGIYTQEPDPSKLKHPI